jgi:hypothetical protein
MPVDDALGLPLHVAGQVGIDDVLALHRRLQRLAVRHVALDDAHARRIVIGEAIGTPQIQGQSGVAVAQQDARGVARQLSVRAEGEDVGHA